MVRWVRRAALALSMVLFLGTLALWIQSEQASAQRFWRRPLRWGHRNSLTLLFSNAGRIGIQHFFVNGPLVRGPSVKDQPACEAFERQFGPTWNSGFLGIDYETGPSVGTGADGHLLGGESTRSLLVHYWLLMLVFATPALGLFWRQIIRRREKEGAPKILTNPLRLLTAVAGSIPFLLVLLLWDRSYRGSDVWMFSFGGHEEVMLTSSFGHWFEFTLLDHWPDQRWGHWHGADYQNVGPMKLWVMGTGGANWKDIWLKEGQVACPRSKSNGPVAYEGSYDRFLALQFVSGTDWVAATAHELGVPYPWLAGGAAMLALPGILLLARAQRLARQRFRGGLCITCGYDLRESPVRCPECGRFVER